MIASNVIALAFTIVFARVLGAGGYGSLAALLSAFIILMVPGSALQVAVARDVSRDLAAGDPDAGAGVRDGWTADRRGARGGSPGHSPAQPLGAVLNVDELWAAAAVPLTAMLWMVLSVERGALQGFERYKRVGWSIVGGGGSRLLFALGLVAIGLDVTGAFLGTALALAAMAAWLAIPLHRHLPPARPPGRGRTAAP